MHEGSLLKNLLRRVEAAARDAGVDRVLGVKVVLGAHGHISPEHLREHFERESRGTAAEGARLEVMVEEEGPRSVSQEILLESIEVE
jgi:hydrogenase nickel incorporation protein HypA/HybF